MSWFQEGYEKVEQRAAEIEEQMNRTYLPDLIVKETDEDCIIRFIISKPITFYQHYLPAKKRSFTCPDGGDPSKGNCPLCATGNKATFTGAYLIADQRYEEWEDKNKKKQNRQNTLKVAKFGVRALKALGKQDEKLKKKGMSLEAVDVEVMRTGSGTDTAYNFTPMETTEWPTPPVPEKEAKENKTYRDLLVEAITPKSKEELMKVLTGGSATPSGGGNGGGGTARTPIDLGDGDEDVINFK